MVRSGMVQSESFDIAIVGGGAAGISTAARLKKLLRHGKTSIAILEPSTTHYYQPLWSLVGAGVYPREVTERSEQSLVPAGVTWIVDSAAHFCPDQNYLMTGKGNAIHYKFLVVATGIQLDWKRIPGLAEGVGRDGICSNYSYDTVESTWRNIENFQGGTAIFTQPLPPIKCGGAPQKIMYLADSYFRKSGVRDKTEIVFCSAAGNIFPVKKYADTLDKVIVKKGIVTRYKHNLVALRPEAKEATFKNLDTGEEVRMHYDMIHVTPPQCAPEVLKGSALANADGWVDVDKFTLRHVRYPNVFSLGDSSTLPTSKTGAAVRKQAPVAAQNLVSAMHGQPLTAKYNGYTSCPLVTGYGSLVMAEFDYDLKPTETFPVDQSKERRSMYLVKKYFLPRLYWHGMLRGRA